MVQNQANKADGLTLVWSNRLNVEIGTSYLYGEHMTYFSAIPVDTFLDYRVVKQCRK